MDNFFDPDQMARYRRRRSESFYVKVMPAMDEIDAHPFEYEDALQIEFATSSNMAHRFTFSKDEARAIADEIIEYINQTV